MIIIIGQYLAHQSLTCSPFILPLNPLLKSGGSEVDAIEGRIYLILCSEVAGVVRFWAFGNLTSLLTRFVSEPFWKLESIVWLGERGTLQTLGNISQIGLSVFPHGSAFPHFLIAHYPNGDGLDVCGWLQITMLCSYIFLFSNKVDFSITIIATFTMWSAIDYQNLIDILY